MKAKITITLLILFCANAAAQCFYPPVKNYRKQDYNAGAQNWSICQDKSGNMYFANNGVLEFDSREWILHYAGNRTAVRSVFWDSKSERLYYGATEEFGYFNQKSDNLFEKTVLTDSLGFQMEDVWEILRLGQNIWLRENNNVFRYGPGGCRKYEFPDKVAVSCIIRDSINIFVNNKGLFSFNGQVFSEVKAAEPLRKLRICAILESGTGLELVSSDKGIFHIENGTLIKDESSLSRELARANVYCAKANGRYTAYGTVEKGVYIYDKENAEVIHLDTESGLQNNTVLSLFFDREGSLWLGLNRGIDCVELNSPFYKLSSNSNEIGSGYAAVNYMGKLWIGSNQGLYFLEKENEIKAIPQIRGQIWSLLKHNNTLFCSCDKGIYIIEGDAGPRLIPLNGCWKLEVLRNREDFLLGSSYDRLFLLQNINGKWQFAGYIQGFEESSKVFEEDIDGSIWFSHWVKGLFRLNIDYEAKKVSSVEFFSKAQNFPQDWGNVPIEFDNGIIFKTDKGFYSYNSIQQRALPREDLNSLFSSPPAGTSVYQCRDRSMIFSSSELQAICRPDSRGRWVMDSLSLKPLCSQRIQGFEDVLELDNGLVMLNTEDGYAIIRSHMEAGDGSNSQVYIKRVTARSGNRDSLIFNSRGNKASMAILLPYRDYSLSFHFACPWYSSGEQSSFSYCLENYDKLWSDYSPAVVKEYTHLPHGRYIFKVRCQSPGREGFSETSISIEIKAPWYKQTWAYIVFTFLVVILAFGVGILIKNKLDKHLRKIEIEKDKELKTKQLALDLERKSQDLTVSTMNIISKNETLMDIDSLLEKAIDCIGSDRNRSLSILNKIHKNIQQSLQHDDVWNKFEANFDIVYNDFLKRLKARYPKLTPTDLKTCAYLKMGLSSKEIAPLLNITLRSVEMNRYRLRKKLELSRDCNLSDFFDSI
ncbi:MAG: two-component regulator propeller domain-containing protein [Candidatus Cryptobacteroides sp.]